MSQRHVVLGTLVVLAIILIWLGLKQAAYLNFGYSISVALGSEPSTVYHAPFPMWLKAAHALIALGALASLVLCAVLRPASVLLAWVGFASATMVGLYDVVVYGTIGTPISLNFYLLVFVIAIFTTYLNRKRSLRA